jgi:CubicO group peptidase (beta-lactamase class C family)
MRRLLAAAALLLWLAVPGAARAQEKLDSEIDRAARTFEVPGAVIVVVEGDRIIYQRATGLLRAGRPERTSLHTPFAIGSITKSFTAAAIARLVDQGKLGWDDKAARLLPELQLHDPYPTRELTIRDMLSHRSGLPSGAGDLLSWPETSIGVEARLAALRALPLSRGFRARYGYSNLLYMAAGVMISRLSGMSWADYVRSSFFVPLGMKDARIGSRELQQAAAAWPHARIDGPLRGLGPVSALPRRYALDSDGAAGAIYASGADLARWMTLQLANGRMSDGTQLFSARTAAEMHALQTPLRIHPSAGLFAPTDPSFSGYGLGWFVRDYHGDKLVYHAGGTLGGVSQVTLLPGRGIGFAILTNSEESGFLRAVELVLLDHYLGRTGPDWIDAQRGADRAEQEAALAAFRSETKALPSGKPSLPIGNYTGRYRDPWFGIVSIGQQGDGLSIAFERSPYLTGRLVHVGGDLFRTRFDEPGMEDAYLTFRIASGRAVSIATRAISPLADFSFDYKDLNLVRDGQ